MVFCAYAKVNLSLEVYARRADGYHALRSVVLPISLRDDLTLTAAPDFASDTGYGERDLALRAARHLQAVAATHSPAPSLTPVKLSVLKRIPAGGGLGGGSADAAATLLALNRWWNLNWPAERLSALGAAIGSDVPAQVLAMAYGCPVRMEGRGESVARLALDDLLPDFLPSRFLVLVNPGVFSSTAEVYAECADRREPTAAPVNDLQPAAVRLHPEIGQALRRLEALGAEGVRMSGSGATVFGFVADQAAAQSLADRLRSEGFAAWTAEPLAAGAIGDVFSNQEE